MLTSLNITTLYCKHGVYQLMGAGAERSGLQLGLGRDFPGADAGWSSEQGLHILRRYVGREVSLDSFVVLCLCLLTW